MGLKRVGHDLALNKTVEQRSMISGFGYWAHFKLKKLVILLKKKKAVKNGNAITKIYMTHQESQY